MIYVVGSGPAGVSCAAALLEQGLAVTMLDAGIELEPANARQVAELRQIDPAQWRGPRVEFLKSKIVPDRMGVGQKTSYGSDFPFQGVQALADITRRGTDATPSLAQGGLSTVWGAAIMPYTATDLDQWPITLADLAPHYRAALGGMDVSAVTDDLAAMFPLYTDRAVALKPSRQAAALLADMNRRKDRLAAAGIRFGSSRLAVRAAERENRPGCVYCGLCLYGCPHNLIYNSADALAALRANPNFTYAPNVIVTRLDESAGQVRITAKSRAVGTPLTFQADRLYLACGPIASTQILLESMQAFDTPLRLIDSCLFLLPLLRLAAAGNVAEERLHTLSQVFLEIIDPAVSPRTVHVQIYTYNDLYPEALQRKLGPLYPLFKNNLSRVLIGQGYLHSDFSPGIHLTLTKRPSGAARELLLQAEPPAAQTAPTIARAIKKLRGQWRATRMFPISPALQISQPGRGFHTGGTFPMARHPGRFQTDILGHPTGFSRVHVVDATVFPSIPATTITLSVMANARRIALGSCED
jgi:choline dehydrogenase-like flavoprotein